MKCFICDQELDLNKCTKFDTKCFILNLPIIRYECYHCNLIFGDLNYIAWDQNTIKLKYQEAYLSYKEGDTFTAELHAFNSLSPNKNGTYLNFASGQLNKTNQYLQNLGYNVYGFEPYSYSGNDKSIITSFQQLKSYKFDGIFANNAIEHLQNPIQDMAFLRSLLKPNGAVTQTTGCYSYRYEFTCFHFFYFIGESLKILSQKAGYVDLIKLDYNPTIENEGYLFRNGN